MSKSFSLDQLTEGIRDRHVGAESNRLMEKWTRTGLLRGLGDQGRETMSRLLENQAAQVLREANVLGSGGSAGSGAAGLARRGPGRRGGAAAVPGRRPRALLLPGPPGRRPGARAC